MEIWGLGGQKARSDQRRELAFEAKDAERRAHVNIQNKDVSRAVLQMAGLLEAEDLGELVKIYDRDGVRRGDMRGNSNVSNNYQCFSHTFSICWYCTFILGIHRVDSGDQKK